MPLLHEFALFGISASISLWAKHKSASFTKKKKSRNQSIAFPVSPAQKNHQNHRNHRSQSPNALSKAVTNSSKRFTNVDHSNRYLV
jgi:hypothetical protein